MNSMSSISFRRLRNNTTAAVRLGGVVRQRLSMGTATASSDETNVICRNHANRQRNFSTSETSGKLPAVSAFAAVDHSKAYERSMNGRHGQQLALALLEGIGKDDLPFNPFEDEEQKFLENERNHELEASNNDDGNESEDSDGYDSDDYDSEDDEDEEDSIYNRDGSVRRKKSTLATLKAGFPSGGVFAVVELAGSQHKITTDDLLVVNKLKPVEEFKIGSVHTLKDILLVGSSHQTLVGMPHVTGAEVDVMVEEITQDAKVIVFKKRRRKHSQRKNGYRRDLTLLRVLNIRFPKEYEDHDHLERSSVDDLDSETLDNNRYYDEAFHSDARSHLSQGNGKKLSVE